jgi:6-phosphofructokinase 2
MIYTITLNPALDKSIWIREIRSAEENFIYQISRDELEPGGKGICVSKALANLGIESEIIGFLGGSHGKKINALINKKQKISSKFIEIAEETRENIIINEIGTGKQFPLNYPGPCVSQDEYNEMIRLLRKLVDPHVFVIGGSLPQGLNPDNYIEIIEIAKKKKAKVVLDTAGEALIKGIESSPNLIKPNIYELKNAAKHLLNINHIGESEKEIANIARKIHNKYDVETVLVSMGARGIIMVTNHEEYIAIPPEVRPAIAVRNTIGAGDSAVAGFISEWRHTPESLKDSLIYAVAAGTATTLIEGTALCQKKDFLELIPKIKLKDLKMGSSIKYTPKPYELKN